MEPLVAAAALSGGVGLAGLAIYAAWRHARRPAEPEPVELEIVIEDDAPVRFVPPASAPAARLARPAAPPPPPSPRSHPARAPAMVLTQGVALQDGALDRRRLAPAQAASAAPAAFPVAAPAPAAPAPRPPMRAPPPAKSWAQQALESAPPEVAAEWARRQVGPVEPGRVAGACGGCGARLSVSTARPLRIACPVCGRTKLLA